MNGFDRSKAGFAAACFLALAALPLLAGSYGVDLVTKIMVYAIFALSPQMRQYLDQQILPRARRGNAQRALVDALYAQGQLKLEYDAARTRTAAEAFEARSGNCLSLLIMTGAFAQALGLQVHYQSVLDEEAWGRSDELHFFIGHVNIRLGARPSRAPLSNPDDDWMVIDNPFNVDQKDPITLIPAIKPDISIFHCPMADRFGNVWIGRRRELDAAAV